MDKPSSAIIQAKGSTLHPGVGKYEVWKGLEDKRTPASKDSFTMTEEELWG